MRRQETLQKLLSHTSRIFRAMLNVVPALPRPIDMGRDVMHHATRSVFAAFAADALAVTFLCSTGTAVVGLAAAALAAPPPTHRAPVVARALVDVVELDRLVIRGRNFSTQASPVVLLSGVALEVLSFSDEEIVARLPLDAPPARYRLQVLAHGQGSSASFEVTLGRRTVA